MFTRTLGNFCVLHLSCFSKFKPIDNAGYSTSVYMYVLYLCSGLLQKKLKKKGAPQPTPAAHQDTPPGDDIPRELPTDLWKPCLQSLYLQGNQIKFLPDSIGDLDGLARLDISG